MADWLTRQRTNSKFTFRRVEWPTYRELEDYNMITGGNVEFSALSDLKESGSVDFANDEVPDDHDLIRVYYDFDDAHGEHQQTVLCTMFPLIPEHSHYASRVEGSIELTSVLSVLSEEQLGRYYTVPAGAYAIEYAQGLCNERNLKTGTIEHSQDYMLKSYHTFEPKDSVLTVVNWLCSTAGFRAVTPDAYGAIQFLKQKDSGAPVFTFKDDAQSIMLPQVVHSQEYNPNVARLSYSTDALVMHAVARNIDPVNRSSLISRRNIEKTIEDDVSELAGANASAMLTNLKNMAVSKLKDNTTGIEYVKFQAVYVPLSRNDVVAVEYTDAGFTWQGAITNIKVPLKPEIVCDIEARRFGSQDMKTDVTGAIDYQA